MIRSAPSDFARYLAARDAHLLRVARQERAKADEPHIVFYTWRQCDHATRAVPDRQTAEDLAEGLRRDPAVRNVRVLSVREAVEDSR